MLHEALGGYSSREFRAIALVHLNCKDEPQIWAPHREQSLCCPASQSPWAGKFQQPNGWNNLNASIPPRANPIASMCSQSVHSVPHGCPGDTRGFLCPQGLSPAPLQPEASSPFPTSCCQARRRTQGVQRLPLNSPSLTLRLPEISPPNLPCLSPLLISSLLTRKHSFSNLGITTSFIPIIFPTCPLPISSLPPQYFPSLPYRCCQFSLPIISLPVHNWLPQFSPSSASSLLPITSDFTPKFSLPLHH